MYIKETQTVTLEFPKEFYLYDEFKKDDEWKEISCGTVGATFVKILKEGVIKARENI